jgi:hypothetical protein
VVEPRRLRDGAVHRPRPLLAGTIRPLRGVKQAHLGQKFPKRTRVRAVVTASGLTLRRRMVTNPVAGRPQHPQVVDGVIRPQRSQTTVVAGGPISPNPVAGEVPAEHGVPLRPLRKPLNQKRE